MWCLHDRVTPDYFGPAAPLVRALGRWLSQADVVNRHSTRSTTSTGRKPVLLLRPPADPAASGIVTGPPPAGRVSSVVIVGRIVPSKGQHLFVATFSDAFHDSDTNATLVGGALLGEADYESGLRAGIDAGPARGRVELTGHVQSAAPHLAAADIVVHASTMPEPYGLVVAEAMAAGRPVIATTSGGPAEMITDGVDGLLVPCGDIAALAAALQRLDTDPALRARLGAAALDTARRFASTPTTATARRWLRTIAARTLQPTFTDPEAG